MTEARPVVTLAALPELLKNDVAVKVAGIDLDGQLRGKLISKKKFLAVAESGFGFSAILFGWDMHDLPYSQELLPSKLDHGFGDLIAVPDLQSFRRIPWERNVPFFLVTFRDPVSGSLVFACPRNLLRVQTLALKEQGIRAMGGLEYEFYQFRIPPTATSTATFLRDNPVEQLPHLTEGWSAYSLTRPTLNKDFYYGVFNTCESFRTNIEGWHTECGPGVFEAALAYDEVAEMADRATLFKYVVKSVSAEHNLTPCFMAKPRQGLPGNSGHVHVSLLSADGTNLFSRDTPDPSPPFPDVAHLSDMGRHFLAGVLAGLPAATPIFAPTINSYKRISGKFYAPDSVSWGLEHRGASVRLIAPPTAASGATRFEVRVPGADANPSLVLAAIVALGMRGVRRALPLELPPLSRDEANGARSCQRLPQTLPQAVEVMMREDSVLREALGNDFVEHFGASRLHECKQWDEAVTDWEVRRYIETV